MSKKEQTLAQRLLDAHVQFAIDEMTGKGFETLIEAEIKHLLKQAGKLTINDVVTRKMIKETAHTYAVQLELHGGIPELIGDIARNIYAHEIQDQTSVHDLMSDHQFNELLDKAVEMHELRNRVIHDIVTNPLYGALASDILFNGIKGYLTQNALTKNIPGMQSMLKLGKSVLSAASGLDKSIEDNLKKYVHKNISATLLESEHFLRERIDDDKLRDVALDVWHELKKKKLAESRDYVSSADIEEFFVIGYEYWRELRKTRYYTAIIDIGVDSFFDKYGDTSLAELLEDIGIREDMLLREAMRFAPHVFKVLKKKKMLEPIVRRQLERFYLSEQAAALLPE